MSLEAALNPSGRWWLKLDKTDIKKGLLESLRGIWNGDADLKTVRPCDVSRRVVQVPVVTTRILSSVQLKI